MRGGEGRSPTGIELRYAGGHCHAPSCLSIELYADSGDYPGELLCKIQPVAGKSAAAQDEENYLYLPPCMWSLANETVDGLPPAPVFFPHSKFHAIKRVNSSSYHYGIMAIFQSTGVYVK